MSPGYYTLYIKLMTLGRTWVDRLDWIPVIVSGTEEKTWGRVKTQQRGPGGSE